MAIYEDVENSFAQALANAVVRVLAMLALLALIVGPLVIGGFLGHLATERLADPEAMAIEMHRPPLPVYPLLKDGAVAPRVQRSGLSTR